MSRIKLLFICNQGENRSRTAAEMFKNSYETQFAGVYSGDENRVLTEELLDWSEIIFVMEKKHVDYLYEHHPGYYLEKRIFNLDISDDYYYNSPDLKKVLANKVNRCLKEVLE